MKTVHELLAEAIQKKDEARARMNKARYRSPEWYDAEEDLNLWQGKAAALKPLADARFEKINPLTPQPRNPWLVALLRVQAAKQRVKERRRAVQVLCAAGIDPAVLK